MGVHVGSCGQDASTSWMETWICLDGIPSPIQLRRSSRKTSRARPSPLGRHPGSRAAGDAGRRNRTCAPIVHAVIDEALWPEFPLGDPVEVFRREDAERFIDCLCQTTRGLSAPRGHPPTATRPDLSARPRAARLCNVLDDRDQLVRSVAVATGELHEITCLLHDRSALGRSGDRNASPAAELEKALVSK